LLSEKLKAEEEVELLRRTESEKRQPDKLTKDGGEMPRVEGLNHIIR
jgi:hypothetical protein